MNTDGTDRSELLRGSTRTMLGGVLVALSMPPWGWWPLSFVGIALYGTTLLATTVRRRHAFLLGTSFALGWYLPAMAWMWFLTPPGYLLASTLFATAHGAAASLVVRSGGASAASPTSSRSRARARSQALSLAAAHTLVEAARLYAPFGGVPLATLGIAHADAPLSRLAPVGGVLLITFVVFGLSFRGARPRFVLAAAVLVGSAGLADSSHYTGDSLKVALVQGGGPQGTRAVDTDFRVVFDRHLDGTRQITERALDLVVWPENVINVDDFAASREYREVAAEAERLGAPLSVGVTEDADEGRFTNAQVVVLPDGSIADRYDKELRVPFGEYMPMRSFLSALGAPTDLVPNDAVAGEGSAVLRAAGVPAAVAISWEVFFGRRVDEGVANGGEWILNPTNGASYTWTILQTQQIASSRLRAREQGRWIAQVAPTGFSAVIDDDGRVRQRTGIGDAEVIITEIPLRTGHTLYGRTGDVPLILMLLALLGWQRRRGRHIGRTGTNLDARS